MAKSCTSIDIFFERNREGWPGYGVDELEMMYKEICDHSNFVDHSFTDVVNADLERTKCHVTPVVPGKISFKPEKGRYFYYMSMPPNPKAGYPKRHNLQLLTYQIAAAWKRFALAAHFRGKENVTPMDWQWTKGNDVHHRCNMGCQGCHNILHIEVVPKSVNMSHRINCCGYMMCPVCNVKIKVCHENNPSLQCMNINYKICSHCAPESYPANERPVGQNLPIVHSPTRALKAPLYRSGRSYITKKRKTLAKPN